MSISDDLLLRVDFSTKNSTPDSFASIGGGANDSLAHRDIYAYAGFHNAANISEYFLGDWDVKGSLQLSEGVSATVDVSAYWSFDRQPEVGAFSVLLTCLRISIFTYFSSTADI